MSAPALADAELRANVAAYRESGFNVSAASRALGMPRQSLQTRLKMALERGLVEPHELHDYNPSRAADYIDARSRKVAAYERMKRKGDWRKPVLVTLPAEPCILTVFGDPHLDADGTDYALFERTWLDMGPRSYGLCVGDWFDNWPRTLAHLYADQTIRPSDGWLLLDHLMQQNGEWLIAACSGNHDDWSHGPIDPVADLMRRHGVVYRQGAVRLALSFGGRVVTVAMRHKWQGRSMYSAAHWGARATREGWWDHIMIGGHIHQDEDRMFPRSNDRFCAHVCQVSSFKEFDLYPEVQGYMGPRIFPVRHLVVDPRREDSDPDMVKVFYSADAAKQHRDAL